MDMLSSDDWCNGVTLLSGTLGASALELHTLLFKTSLDGLGITVLVLAVLNRDDVVGVLFREHLTVFDWLN